MLFRSMLAAVVSDEPLLTVAAARDAAEAATFLPVVADEIGSEERRVGKECRSRWSPYH